MKKWLIIIGISLIVIMSYFLNIFKDTMKPFKEAKEQAINIAKSELSIQSVTDFSIYNGSKAYYVIEGVGQNGNDLIAWIPKNKKDGKIIVKEKKDGISKEEAIQKLHEEKNPQEIISVKLGVENNIPLWEIFYRSNDELINYYYVDFRSGEWLKDIQNL